MPAVVIILMGLPGCGKSTWAAVHYPNSLRIDGDSLKTSAKVAAALDCALTAFEVNRTNGVVIVDATNGTIERRQDLISGSRKHGAVVVGIRFTMDAKAAIERCRLRHEAGGVKIHKVAIYKIAKYFVEPSLAEGFASIGHTN